ncbi:MAG TPA: hypothetical protein G4O15_07020 [Dehalococcoidia bacterium]|nr:hypothetical protein [Dehalococcoidia bacterium]
MATEVKRVSDAEKVAKRRIRSAVMLNKISTVTDDFFITHSYNITDLEWSQLMDKIVEIVNTQRS